MEGMPIPPPLRFVSAFSLLTIFVLLDCRAPYYNDIN